MRLWALVQWPIFRKARGRAFRLLGGCSAGTFGQRFPFQCAAINQPDMPPRTIDFLTILMQRLMCDKLPGRSEGATTTRTPSLLRRNGDPMIRFIALLTLPAIALAAPVTVPHQGRLMDVGGTPMNGPQTLIIEIADSSGPAANIVWRNDFNVNVSNGYYSVVLDQDENADPLDSSDFVSDTWLRVFVDNDQLAEQFIGYVPRAATTASVIGEVTVTGSNELVLGQTTSTSCTNTGALIYDPTLALVKVCIAQTWQAIGSGEASGVGAGFETFGGAIRWDDGTSPSSCKGYLDGVAPIGRANVPGTDVSDDGLYRITVNGNPSTVYCDMHAEGGGWTLVYSFARTNTPTTIYSGVTSRFPQGDNWIMPQTDGVAWFLNNVAHDDWVLNVQPSCAQDAGCSNAFTVDRTETFTDSWVKLHDKIGNNNIVVEYPDSTTYTEGDWTGWDTGYNGGAEPGGVRCNSHIWWNDYSTDNPFYMPARVGTSCLHAGDKTVFFWAR
jgi:hypothetical protein